MPDAGFSLPAIREVELPKFKAVVDGIARPRWSVMIPTFQRETFLEATLQSVLDAADFRPDIEFCVVDNCSENARISEIVARVGQGRIRFHRNASNLGMFENWNECIRLARGKWIHILHDDDLVLPRFYRDYEALILKYPEAGLVAGPAIFIDEGGQRISTSKPRWKNSGEWGRAGRSLAAGNCFLCPTIVVQRSVYEKVGGFRTDLRFASDWEMWTRIANSGTRIAAHTKPYALYRLHVGSESSALFADGVFVKETAALEEYFARKYPWKRSKIKYGFACHLGIAAALTAVFRGLPKSASRQMGHVNQLKPSLKHRVLWALLTGMAAIVALSPRWLVNCTVRFLGRH